MRHLKKICETNGGKIKEEDLRFHTGMILLKNEQKMSKAILFLFSKKKRNEALVI